jgi:hypothetical protein
VVCRTLSMHGTQGEFLKQYGEGRLLLGTRRVQAVAKWLRHYATSRKVAGLRCDEVNTFFFNLPNLPTALDNGVYSASNRNVYQKWKNYISGECGLENREYGREDPLR